MYWSKKLSKIFKIFLVKAFYKGYRSFEKILVVRDRFGIAFHLDFYSPQDLSCIVARSANILNLKLDKESAIEIGKRARGTPRIANRLLRRIADFAFGSKKSKNRFRNFFLAFSTAN